MSEKKMNKLPPLPPLPPTEAFLPFPGEPDKAAEARLRANLRLFRTVATNLERIQAAIREPLPKAFRELLFPPLPKLPPKAEEQLKQIDEMMKRWRPEARKVFAPIIQTKPEVKERLLAIEQTFIEKGWRLPKWERPSWLLE